MSDTDDASLFQQEVKDARPLEQTRVLHPIPKPRRKTQRARAEESQRLADSFSDHYIPAHELNDDDQVAYLRAGHSPDILRKLRRGHWQSQDQLDLHGLIAEEARRYVAEFLLRSIERKTRCVRIIHGKGLGSRNGEPVLKNRLRSWLVQQEEVIAYCQARAAEGGSGALVVLFKSGL